MDPDLIIELLQFLHSSNSQARQISLSKLLELTPEGSPHRSVFFDGLRTGSLQDKDSGPIRDLKLLCRDQLAIAHDAFRALINLSNSPLVVSSLSELSFMTFLVAYILNSEAILADLATMLLSNMTAFPAPCITLLSLTVSVVPNAAGSHTYPQSRSGTCGLTSPAQGDEKGLDVLALPLLIDAFVQGAQVRAEATEEQGERRPPPRKAQLHFLASVFANLTLSPAGRTFILTPRSVSTLGGITSGGYVEYPLAKLVPFTEHPDTIRRGGAARTLKNCASHTAAHRALLSHDAVVTYIPPSTVEAPGLNVIPYLLLPLAGPEEYDLEDQEQLLPDLQLLPPTKKREPDPALRLMHVETLLLLSHTRWGRERLRESGVYEIVRVAHEHETVDKISEHIERLVNLLKREEGPETIDENDRIGIGAESFASGHPVDDKDEDEDCMIEEV